jgi:hypothetical protein
VSQCEGAPAWLWTKPGLKSADASSEGQAQRRPKPRVSVRGPAGHQNGPERRRGAHGPPWSPRGVLSPGGPEADNACKLKNGPEHFRTRWAQSRRALTPTPATKSNSGRVGECIKNGPAREVSCRAVAMGCLLRAGWGRTIQTSASVEIFNPQCGQIASSRQVRCRPERPSLA